MAEAWSVPPWEIEARCSAVWAERFLLWRQAQHEMAEVHNGSAQILGGRLLRRRK